MRLQSLAMHPRDLCSLIFRLLPELLGLPPFLLKKVCKDEHVHPRLMRTTVGMLPELPKDILIDIFVLLDTPDLVRAGSVCSSWYSASTSLCNLGLCRRSQTPCLLYTSESAGESAAGLYSLAEKRSYKLTLPDPPIRSRYVIGSNHGWIVSADNRSELHLLNPITGDQIALPSVTTIEQVKPVFDDYGALHKYELSRYTALKVYEAPRVFDLGELREYVYLKAFLSSDPSTGNYYVVLIHYPYMQLSFARAGDDKWTWLPPHTYCSDCIIEEDLFYVASQDGAIHAFDISGPAVTQRVILDEIKDYISDKIYIAQAPSGDLLQIWKYTEDPDYNDDVSELQIDAEFYARCSTTCKVHKVDLAAKKLVEKNSLGENVLFLGHNPSLCLRAGEYPRLKANHVYFTDDCDYLPSGQSQHRYIRIHNLENSCSEEIVSPQLWANWPAPVWVIPNPRKMNLA